MSKLASATAKWPKKFSQLKTKYKGGLTGGREEWNKV
jgi:hypothetical protein